MFAIRRQMGRFADAAHDFADDIINTVIRILQRVGGDQDPRQVRLLKRCLRPAAGCVLQRFQGKPEIAAVCGVRGEGTRWNDHRHVNRRGKRRQRRWVIGDPIGGRRRQRNPFGRFHAFAGTLSRDLHLKDRLAVESGMLKGQRDQFSHRDDGRCRLCPSRPYCRAFGRTRRRAAGHRGCGSLRESNSRATSTALCSAQSNILSVRHHSPISYATGVRGGATPSSHSDLQMEFSNVARVIRACCS